MKAGPRPCATWILSHLAGAQAYLLAANTTGYGNASVSLLDAAATGVDGDGNAWVVNGALAELSNSGVPSSPSTGYGYFVAVSITFFPDSIAPDGSGNLWIRGAAGGNSFTDTLVEMISASAPVVTPIAAGVKNNTLGTRP